MKQSIYYDRVECEPDIDHEITKCVDELDDIITSIDGDAADVILVKKALITHLMDIL